jgi:hypothetical protein
MSLKPIPKQIRELRGLTKFQKEVIITEEERDLINTRRAAIQTDRDIIRKKSDLKNAVELVRTTGASKAEACRRWNVAKKTLGRHLLAAENGTTVKMGPPLAISVETIDKASSSQLVKDLRKDSMTKNEAFLATKDLIMEANPFRYHNKEPDRKTVTKAQNQILPVTKRKAAVQAGDRKKALTCIYQE